jgi:hypothetical protein
LTRDQVANHCGLVIATFDAWVRQGLLPSPSSEGWWDGEVLSKAIEQLARDGHQHEGIRAGIKTGYVPLPNVHRVLRVQSDGAKKYHYYRRGLPGRLPGKPGSPEFMSALIKFERRLAAQQRANEPTPTPTQQHPPQPKQKSPRDDSPALHQPSPPPPETAPNLVTQAELAPPRARRKAPPPRTLPNNLPLYPEERQLAAAILGPDRAGDWRAIARVLEREGLPPIDPLMGARFWPAVQEFFESRNGLDERIVAGVKLPAIARVRCVPFVPDGKEVLDGEEASADPSRGRVDRPRRPRL